MQGFFLFCFFEKAKRHLKHKIKFFHIFSDGKFWEKYKVGLKFGRHKKSTYTTAKATTSATTQYRSPVHKRARVSRTACKTFASPCVGYKSTSIRKRKLSFSVRLMTSPFRKSPLSKRKTSTSFCIIFVFPSSLVIYLAAHAVVFVACHFDRDQRNT